MIEAVPTLPLQIVGPAVTVANGSGFTVTAATLLRVLPHAGVPDVMDIAVKVTLKVPAEAVVALEEAAVVNVTEVLPVPLIVFPVTVPSV